MDRVLLLNASWEPLRTLSYKRAIVLLLQDKAEVVELEENGVIRSAHKSFGMPSVIRLKYFVKVPYKAKLPLNRRAVLTRDNHECQFVGCTRKGTTIDHVIPRAQNGLHEWTNVVAACQRCNAKKADQTIEQLNRAGSKTPDGNRWELKRRPFTPKGTQWLVIGTIAKEDWEPYLADWLKVV